jgi:PAS domain S-box-containing protein
MAQPILRILHLEDSPEDAELQYEFLNTEGFEVAPLRVQSRQEFVSALENGRFDVILADNSMPGFDGLSALSIAKEKVPDLPFVFVSGTLGEEVAIESLKNGATDYVLKQRLARLAPVVRRALQETEIRNERRRALEALRESEMRYRMVAQTISDYAYAYRIAPNGSVELEWVTDSYKRITGYAPAELSAVGGGRAIILPEDAEIARQHMERIFAGQPSTAEYRIITKGGQIRWLQDSAQPMRDERENRVVRVIGAAQDITARRQAEQRLRASETRFRSLVENGSDEISIVAADGTLLYKSPSASPTLGYQYGEFIRQDIFQLMHPEDRERILSQFVQLVHDPTLHPRDKFRLKHQNGSWRWVEAVATNLIAEPSVGGIVINYHDITDRVRAEEALRESEEYFRSLIENASDAITVIDPTGVVKYQSPASEKIIGFKPEELLGENLIAHIHPQDVEMANSAFRAAMKQPGRSMTAEVRIQHRDGSWRIIESVFKAYLRHGAELTAIINSRDITERKQAENKIQKQIAYLTALGEVDRTIASTFDMRLSLETLVTQAMSLLQADAAAVLLFNPLAHTLQYFVGRGFRAPVPDMENPLRLDEGYAGRAVLDGTRIFVANLTVQSEHSQRMRALRAEGFVSYLGALLIARRQVKGVLELFTRTPFQPEQEHLDVLKTLALQAAIAIDNATLFEGLQRSNLDLRMAYDSTIEGWSRAMDLRDKETEGHTQRVTEMTLRLARAFGVSDEQLVHIQRGALLHDIGKMGIPDSILLKPEALTDAEWAIMRQHPIYAYELLSPIAYLHPALDIPYSHHEKWDGSGYPRGLKGAEIPLAARLFAIVDVWDALRSDRPYRKAWSEARVREHLRASAGTHFDPHVVELFLRILDQDQAP